MLPAAFIPLATFPLTATGKIDRKALPPPLWDHSRQSASYIAPRDHIEEYLASLWHKSLNIKKVGIKDNFFDLGGDSLIAATLFAQIEQRFNIRLPVSTMLEHDTIEKLAVLLRNSASYENHLLVPFRTEGDQPPLFLFPGAAGDAMIWQRLATCLAPGHPLYGLQAVQSDGTSLYILGIQAAAERFLQAIRKLQPHGPYFLVGYSLGGLVAFESARLLSAAGESTAFLGIIDSPAPNSTDRVSFPDLVRLHSERLQKLPWRERPPYISNAVRRFLVGLARRRKIRNTLLVKKLVEKDDFAAMRLASRSYQPGIFSGPATIFRVTEKDWFIKWDPTAGWQSLILNNLCYIDVPGDHLTVMEEPNIQTLADKLSQTLQMRG
jgi:thioesterase domain-containing protein/acyl carrier protein